MAKIEAIYYGKRDTMIAEVGTLDCYQGRYLVQLIGDADWDAEGFGSIRDAKRHAKTLAQDIRGQGCRDLAHKIDQRGAHTMTFLLAFGLSFLGFFIFVGIGMAITAWLDER